MWSSYEWKHHLQPFGRGGAIQIFSQGMNESLNEWQRFLKSSHWLLPGLLMRIKGLAHTYTPQDEPLNTNISGSEAGWGGGLGPRGAGWHRSTDSQVFSSCCFSLVFLLGLKNNIWIALFFLIFSFSSFEFFFHFRKFFNHHKSG